MKDEGIDPIVTLNNRRGHEMTIVPGGEGFIILRDNCKEVGKVASFLFDNNEQKGAIIVELVNSMSLREKLVLLARLVCSDSFQHDIEGCNGSFQDKLLLMQLAILESTKGE